MQQFKSQNYGGRTDFCEGATLPSTSNNADFVEFTLSEFSIYLPENRFNSFEMRRLSHLLVNNKAGEFLFNGILNVGNARHYVQAVPFNICSIRNYVKDIHDVGGSIWLQSHLNSKTDIYYRLAAPAPEYVRFHDEFKWSAELAKHFVDFCQTFGRHEVSIFHFRTQFSDWIERNHSGSVNVRAWRSKYGKDDFRQPVAANIKFLHRETNRIDSELLSNPIWAELLDKDFIPQQLIIETKTVVTPYVYECFKHLRFGHQLKSVNLNNVSKSQHSTLGKKLSLTADSNRNRLFVEIPSCRQGGDEKPTAKEKFEHQQKVKEIKVGNILSVTKDG
jgi:DNA (cytosine-5)-methyltransferase 1